MTDKIDFIIPELDKDLDQRAVLLGKVALSSSPAFLKNDDWIEEYKSFTKDETNYNLTQMCKVSNTNIISYILTYKSEHNPEIGWNYDTVKKQLDMFGIIQGVDYFIFGYNIETSSKFIGFLNEESVSMLSLAMDIKVRRFIHEDDNL